MPDLTGGTNHVGPQLAYDGTMRSAFFKAYPNTEGPDDTGTWSCRP